MQLFLRLNTFLVCFIVPFCLANGQDPGRVEAFSFQLSPQGISSDTVLSSVEYFDSSGKRNRMQETWWSNGWYRKTQFFDTLGHLVRKTLVIDDSAYTVETRYELDNMGNVVNEYTQSSSGEDFVMAYSNSYAHLQLIESKMIFVNLKNKNEKNPPRGYIKYTYDGSGRKTSMHEVFAGEKDVTIHYTYYANGLVRTEQRIDHLGNKEFTMEFSYNEEGKLAISRSLSGDIVTSVTTFIYHNSRLVRQETMLNDRSKQIVMYFYH